MTQQAEADLAGLLPAAVAWRRALHRCPQPAWQEFFATAFIAEKLVSWGYKVQQGQDIIAADKQLLPPETAAWQAAYQQALAAGAKEEYLRPAQGGFTGAVGVLHGAQPGPTVAFRFDIDANNIQESGADSHRPARYGFASGNPGYAHMCGHDVHTATGLLLACYLAGHRQDWRGTVKLIFQPNEENMSGAAAMVAKGVLDDVDYLFGGHVGMNVRQVGHIALNVHSFMALSRFIVTFTGQASHAALKPEGGRNALLGACAAATHLYAIARHGDGASRVNVGKLHAGTDWNVIPGQASLWVETRGVTNDINAYMVEQARAVLAGAARMYGLELTVEPAAAALSGGNSPALVALGTRVAQDLPCISRVVPETALNASEDVTIMMDRVQQRGGQALFAVFGTPVGAGHHSTAFDVDERVMLNAAAFYAAMLQAVTGPAR